MLACRRRTVIGPRCLRLMPCCNNLRQFAQDTRPTRAAAGPALSAKAPAARRQAQRALLAFPRSRMARDGPCDHAKLGIGPILRSDAHTTAFVSAGPS